VPLVNHTYGGRIEPGLASITAIMTAPSCVYLSFTLALSSALALLFWWQEGHPARKSPTPNNCKKFAFGLPSLICNNSGNIGQLSRS